ncbi:putative metal-dependent hydrolase [Aneurinibacillus sp. Ricciae_BoGa-3]|uniref:YfiT family bacillithiol transferase n=1 Tax=Aneurinibacillus sp. Ricciae_BoGa-3 TaxID=3022697 RepID=UPI002341A0CE|nr:putative metal-dependent hydrolase [Aneurinibacillus sp. Ricciae_BoGa-3]WCK52814.1 putative metal-dependent hydrolase [Aneurinibacillus sp. Ricciae_BoGa-3]
MDTAAQYPIGKFTAPGEINAEQIKEWGRVIGQIPAQLRKAVQGLTQEQLNTPYRHKGWTVRQVVHHIADGQLNGYVRFRLALTEEQPTIKPFQEEKWAELQDARTAPIDISLNLVDAIHARWELLINSLTMEDFQQTYIHPENGSTTLFEALSLYAYHGHHHIAQIKSLRERMGWI